MARKRKQLLWKSPKLLKQSFCGIKLSEIADKVHDRIQETLNHMSFSEEHWMRIRTSHTLEGINWEIKYRTKLIDISPDEESALMLVW